MVEFAGLEKLGCGDRFWIHFPGKMAIRVSDPWRRLNHMMGLNHYLAASQDNETKLKK